MNDSAYRKLCDDLILCQKRTKRIRKAWEQARGAEIFAAMAVKNYKSSVSCALTAKIPKPSSLL